jgi:hypothetical protein
MPSTINPFEGHQGYERLADDDKPEKASAIESDGEKEAERPSEPATPIASSSAQSDDSGQTSRTWRKRLSGIGSKLLQRPRQLPSEINTTFPNRALRGTPVNDQERIRLRRGGTQISQESSGMSTQPETDSIESFSGRVEEVGPTLDHLPANATQAQLSKETSRQIYRNAVRDIAAKKGGIFAETRAKFTLHTQGGSLTPEGVVANIIDRQIEARARMVDSTPDPDTLQENRNLRRQVLGKMKQERAELEAESAAGSDANTTGSDAEETPSASQQFRPQRGSSAEA